MQALDVTPSTPEVQPLLAALCAQYGITPAPRLEWSRRMVKTLGVAYPRKNLIRLSAWLSEEQAQTTLRHELAHIAAAVEGEKGPHGTAWRRWAVTLGIPPVRSSTHGPANAPPKNTSRSVWGLECPKCGLRLARQRVRQGLYHRGCGPRAGRFVRSMKDSAERVYAWVLQSSDKTQLVETA